MKRGSTKRIFLKKSKKAIGAEVDWIIAGGIFLIYLLMTLVYFKPGLNPVFNPDNLLDIVEDGFDHDAYWTITTQPMFVEAIPCEKPKSGGGTDDCTLKDSTNKLDFVGNRKWNGDAIISGTNEATFPIPLEHSTTKLFFVKQISTSPENPSKVGQRDKDKEDKLNKQKTTLIEKLRESGVTDPNTCNEKLAEQIENEKEGVKADEATEKIYETCSKYLQILEEIEALTSPDEITSENPVKPSEISQEEYREGYIKFNTTSKTIRLQPYFSITLQKFKYLFIYSNKIINKEDQLSGTEESIELPYACNVANFSKDTKIIEYTSPNKICKAAYELGVAKTVKGISLASVSSYADIKCGADANAPIGYKCIKQLWGYPELKEFKIRIYTKGRSIAEFPKEPIIPTNINVYSRQFNSFVLNEDGLRDAVTVNILVW